MAFQSKVGNISIGLILILCMAYQVYSQVNCTTSGPGRFANPTDTTCRNYTYCVYVSTNNTYLTYNYVCPSTSVFNPNLGRCTAPANYACAVTG